MKIILNPNEGATRADVLESAQAAHFAIAQGIADQAPGHVMCVNIGPDPRNTYGIIRRKGCVSVYPPVPAQTDGDA